MEVDGLSDEIVYHSFTQETLLLNTTQKPTDDYDAKGALYFTVTVVFVYGMSMVLLLFSYMRKRHDLHTIYDHQVAIYLKGLPKARLRADKQWAKKAMKQRLKEWEQLYNARRGRESEIIDDDEIPRPPSSSSSSSENSETSLGKYYRRQDNRIRPMHRLSVPSPQPTTSSENVFVFPAPKATRPGAASRLTLPNSRTKGSESPKVPVYVSSEKVWVWVGSHCMKELEKHGLNKEGERVTFISEDENDSSDVLLHMERVTAL
ncbi:uncharacterized protein LOC141899177 [Tubulanus polymorphus]|uniref:uncharacterized protein LOC141899177 n=1 Tax=Tubulanus polymorphus TaxID=672921 RepID=UPI003DA2689C